MSCFVAYLQSRGFSEEAADIFGAFLHSAVHLLVEAQRSLAAHDEWTAFSDKDGAMGKIKVKGPHKGHSLPDEVAISQELEQRMRDIFGQDPERWPALALHYPNFHVERPILSGRKRGKKARRSDIEIISLKPKGPSLVMEAKVIEEKADVSKRLLGPEGIECFRGVEAYARNGRFGGLLAYTVQEDGPFWRKALADAYAAYPACIIPLASVLVDPPGFDIQIVPIKRPVVSSDAIEMLNIVFRFERRADQGPLLAADTSKLPQPDI